ncbi:type II secretion system protein [Candidatus Nomurabacteria bacterium]|jgi:prepilin-type N-terminal cleavage/methylation domain-containing protein|nr:MAG: type II secretion system protein [Candidatus Nomurabacteria bacterium]
MIYNAYHLLGKYLKSKLAIAGSDNRGLTFIELIVVLSIVGAISSTVLFQFGSFSSNVTLQNLAQDIALIIKKAQTNAISGSLSSGFIAGQAPSYGVNFDTTSGNQNKFNYFRDIGTVGITPDGILNGNCNNPGASGNECLGVTTIQSSDTIVSLCDGGGKCTYKNLSVTFSRPFPDPTFRTKTAGVAVPLTTGGAQIVIQSAKGLKKTIIIWPIGQISVVDGDAKNLFPNGGSTL